MESIVSRLDVTQIFCDVDDFCSSWERMWQQVPQLPSMTGERRSTSRMHLSEVMTIALAKLTEGIAFHGSGYRTFKEFYTLHVLQSWRLVDLMLEAPTRALQVGVLHVLVMPKW
ncbi:MAG: hypothetical protein V7L05_26880 [Nostoc sp.]